MSEKISVRPFALTDAPAWDAFVETHPEGALYHLSGWREVIEKTYGHKTYYLIAESDLDSTSDQSHRGIQGILPWVHLKSLIFGNTLISMPYVDDGGILATDEMAVSSLLRTAIKQGNALGATTIELRHAALHPFFENKNGLQEVLEGHPMTTSSHKVRMVLDLPSSSEELLSSFKAKLRSQIKRPQKEGLISKVGGLELLDDFYEVFVVNMRDLGSPVHAKAMMENTLRVFAGQSRICLVYQGEKPIAGGIVIGFKDVLRNLWASSLRAHSRFSPNMLLYWTMLAYACEQGYTKFDFGRSTPGEGTYKFKAQWGAVALPLYWHYITLQGRPVEDQGSKKGKFDTAMGYWKKLPVPVTKVFGPMIRKHIGL